MDMSPKYLTTLLISMAVAFTSCSDNDSFTTSPSNLLTFGQDTLSLDTVFSTIPSPHKLLMVHNYSGDGIRITNTRLQNGNQTGFRVNVNGTYLSEAMGYQVNDMELRNGDSLRIFVEVTTPNNLDTLPKLVSDNIVFTLESGVRQQVNLKAWSWDAILMKGITVNNDTTIANPHGKPIVVYDSILVKENATMTIAPGTTIYFHNGAGIDVYGTLKAVGEKDKEITLRCDRLDRMVSNLTYDNNPGQWGGIRLRPASYDNEVAYVDIHGGTTALHCDTATDASRLKLYLHNSSIHNMKGCGVKAANCFINIENTQISNAMDTCLAVIGGNVNVNNSTIAQYFPFDANRGPALTFANAKYDSYYLLNMTVRNSIIKGYADDVIYWSRGTLDNPLEVKFENCLLRTPLPTTSDSEMFIDCIHEDPADTLTTGYNSFVRFDTDFFFYDFTPKEGSPAIGKANPSTALPEDRNGKPRNMEKPDIGCYETEKQTEQAQE